MAFEAYTITDIITSKVLYQYKESGNLIQYIDNLTTCFQELEDVFADILNERQFEDATGYVLDIYGIILGQGRGTYAIQDVQFFGLDADDANNPVPHKGLGDVNDPTVGGVFRSIDQPITDRIDLPDDAYRRVLQGTIEKNNFDRGYESLIEAINATMDYTDTGKFQITEDFTTATDPFVQITFTDALSDIEKAYFIDLDVLPKPGGIRYEYADANGAF